MEVISMPLLGDCLEVLKELPNNSIDSLITDPPAGISFMGKEWDEDKGGRKQWIAWMTSVMQESLRVLKPGAHGLVWAIPRTSHWTATALEDAGFEIRDVVTHLFGSGFPKSLDISKAIDKAAGTEREMVGHKGGCYNTPINDIQGGSLIGGKSGRMDAGSITAPVTPEAKQWHGWGTALKPASEHWILVRKPLEHKHTVAANVLKRGTGGINIDASRVEGAPRTTHSNGNVRTKSGNPNHGNNPMPLGPYAAASGRFPANLVFSHNEDCVEVCTPRCAVAMLDEQSSGLKGDSVGASRFFYCAKASKKDKGADNTHPTVKSSNLMSYLIKLITPPKGVVLDPFMGSGSTGVSALKEGFSFIGIEKQEEYFRIAEARILNVNKAA